MEKILEKYKEVYLHNHDYDCDYEDFDDNEENEIPEEIQAINLLNDLNIESIDDFKNDSIGLATYYIKIFFKDKFIHELTSPDYNLLDENKILTVVNTSIIMSVQKSYKVLENYINITQEDINKAKKNGDVTEDIKLINETLKSLYKAGVPQQFAGGMMILYLEFCKGINFGT